MRFAFTDEQKMIREAVRSFLAERATAGARAKGIAQLQGFDAALWREMAVDMGWAGLIIPETHGGLGLGVVELAALMEELGAALIPSPFESTVCLAVQLLLVSGDEKAQAEYFPRIAAGNLTATVAVTEPGGEWNPALIKSQYVRSGSEIRLSAVKYYVPFGDSADVVFVAARKQGTQGATGLSLFAVPCDLPGLIRRALVTMDQTRRQAAIICNDLILPAASMIGEEGRGDIMLAELSRRASTTLAAFQVGAAQRCLDMSVDYTKGRVQFGRSLGSFQTVKHKAADMMIGVESARSIVYYAAALADSHSDEFPEAVAAAKVTCSETYFKVAADAIQLHGGIGFTWEYDLHHYFKNARATEVFLGIPDAHRDVIADHLQLSR
jgi:alkylation response protein AidB-like acyl-CoA dehydrogenase